MFLRFVSLVLASCCVVYAASVLFCYSFKAADAHDSLRSQWQLATQCAAETPSQWKYQFHDYSGDGDRPSLCIVFPSTGDRRIYSNILARNPVFLNTTSEVQEAVETRKGLCKRQTQRFIKGDLHYEDIRGNAARLSFSDSAAVEVQHVLDFLQKRESWCDESSTPLH